MKIILSISLIFAIVFFAQAQSSNQADLVYTKKNSSFHGSVFRGEIKQYVQGEFVVLQLKSGDIIRIKEEDLKKIKQKEIRLYQFKEKGWYQYLALGVNGGIGTSRYERLVGGFNAEYTFGKQFNRLFGVGLTVGADRYFGGKDIWFLPISINTRGYLLKRNTTPFYSLNVGYGLGILATNNDEKYSKARGGLMFHPAVGIRFGSNSSALSLDVGLKVQDAFFEYSTDKDKWGYEPWFYAKVEDRRYVRTVFRIGWLF